MAHTFVELPTEMLEAIFLHLDPQSLLSVSQTSRFLNKLTGDAPLIWRHFCRTHYKTWALHHNVAAIFAGPLSNVNWRALFIHRVKVERETLRLLQCVLESPTNRIKHINQIADFGYDAKETLLKEYACSDDAEDVLARRYYAKEALERIQRDMSISIWRDLHSGKGVPIERALGAFDVFTMIGEDVDFETITNDVNQLALDLLGKYANFPSMATRFKAIIIASFLREQGYCGVSNASYHALRNNFIGFVLHSSTHESLPLISVAIFCALARRLGLDARPCGFLFHVYCIVRAPKNYSLEGEYRPTSSDDLHSMYLDPFRSSDEVKADDLQRVLRESGVPSSQHEHFLTDTNTREMVLRTARNIINSVQTIRQGDIDNNESSPTWINAYPDMDSSFYAAIWSMIMLGPRNDEAGGLSNIATRRRQYLPYLLDHLRTRHPWDVTLLERYINPFFGDQHDRYRLEQIASDLRSTDSLPELAKYRNGLVKQQVSYKIGQLFKHKRYHYEGVITGWDKSCNADEEWIEGMGVDSLVGGRNQSFYHVLVSDKSIRYVAEENIAIVHDWDKPSAAMTQLAGRHFKRWDRESRSFVSNIRGEYPDD